jgi:uncharacterized protein YqeY
MLLNKLKADFLAARKNKDTIKISLLSCLIGDLGTAAINGKAELSEIEIQKVIKKFLNNIEEFIKLSPGKLELLKEKEILEVYLPQQLSVEVLTSEIKSIIAAIENASIKSLGLIVKELKVKHEGKFDGKHATDIIKGILV